MRDVAKSIVMWVYSKACEAFLWASGYKSDPEDDDEGPLA